MPILNQYKVNVPRNGRFFTTQPSSPLADIAKVVGDEYAKREMRKVERDVIIQKPKLAEKIRAYQNTADVNSERYIQGYTDLVSEHYDSFKTSSGKSAEYLRLEKLNSMKAYQSSALRYQQVTLRNQDNAKIETYLGETLNGIAESGVIPDNTLRDLNRIIELSDNIPNSLKSTIKKNAVNDLLTSEIQAGITNDGNISEIRDKLKSYKKKMDPKQYRSLHKQLTVKAKNDEKQRQLLNKKIVRDFEVKLDGYRTCVTTGNCPVDITNMRTDILSSGVDAEDGALLSQRFDDITELSGIFTEISNDPTGMQATVDAYVTGHTDENANNARRNTILRKYHADRTQEFRNDPVQFAINNNDEVRDLVIQLEEAEGGDNEADITEELYSTISAALEGKTDRVLTNSEITNISSIDDYKQRLDTVKQLIAERGTGVVDELTDKGVLTNDFRAISNISEAPMQYKVFGLIRDEKELKDTYANTDDSYKRTMRKMKNKPYFSNFLESMRYNDKGINYVNSVSKLATLEVLRNGDFDSDSIETAFTSMLGDYHVVNKVMLPLAITEEVADERFDNIREADFLSKVLNKQEGFTGKSMLGGLPSSYKKDILNGLVDSVESGDVDFIIKDDSVVIVGDGKYVRNDDGTILRIPFDEFDTPAKRIPSRDDENIAP